MQYGSRQCSSGGGARASTAPMPRNNPTSLSRWEDTARFSARSRPFYCFAGPGLSRSATVQVLTQATQSVAQPLLRLTKSVFSWKRVFHSECTRTVFDALKMYGMPPPGGGPARMLKAGPRSGKRGHEPGSGLLSSVQHVPGDCMSSTCTQRPPLLSSSVVARSRGICCRTLCFH